MKASIFFINALSVSLIAGLATGAGEAQAKSRTSAVPSGQVLTVWSWKDGNFEHAARQIAMKWAMAHGDTVKWINETHNPNGFSEFQQAARGGNGPDIAFGIPVNIGTLHEEGLVAQVPHQYVNPRLYAQGVVSSSTYQNQGWYALPVTTENVALFYNKKMVKTPPKTWSQFKADADKYGFMFDQANFYYDYAFIAGYGGYIFKNKNGVLDPTNIGLNNTGSVAAYKLLASMDNRYHWMTPSVNGGIALSKFAAGKIGMYISGPWDTSGLQASKIPFGISELPTLPNGKRATPFLGVQTVIVNAKSKTQVADWSLADVLSNKEAQVQYFERAQQIPALLSLQKSSEVQRAPFSTAFANEANYAQAVPDISQMDSVWSAASIMKNILNGSVTPQQGGDDFVKNIKSAESLSN